MSIPIVELKNGVPKNDREWNEQFKRVNKAIQYSGGAAILGALTSISERTGTPISDLLALIGDDGRASTERFMPIINWANAGSLQSAVPLSASADATTATINIDAHSVHYGGEQIDFSAGVVIGAPVSTPVYIYADDPDLEGGAVTYEFTLDYIDLADSKDRYFVGAIVTPVSSISAAVSAITNANPGVVTTGAAHGFTTGDVVDFAAIVGTTELNTGTYTITVISPTTFSVVDTTTFGVYVSGGTVTRVSTPADGLGGAGGGTEYYDPGFYYP